MDRLQNALPTACVALLLLALFFSASVPWAVAGEPVPARTGAEARAEEDLAAVLARVARARGHAARGDLLRLGASGEAKALDLLEEIEPQITTVGGRLALLEAFGRFGGVSELEHRALSRVRAAARSEPLAFLRREALRVLSEAPGAARDYLGMLVESPLEDDQRIRAMRLHVQGARETDVGWYRQLLSTGGDRATLVPKGGEADPESAAAGRPHGLDGIRALAFEGLMPWLTADELAQAAGSRNASRVVRALPELERRGDPRAAELAERVARDRAFHPQVRARALDIAATLGSGQGLLSDVIDDAARRDAPGALWRAVGPVIGRHATASTVVDVARRWPRARDHEKPILLAVLASAKDERGLQLVRRAVRDTQEDVRLLAIDLLSTNGDLAARGDIERAFDRSREGYERGLILDWLDRLLETVQARDAAHERRLVTALASRHAQERNAALAALGRGRAVERTGEIAERLVHADWSTRMAALEALEALRTREATGAIVGSMGAQSGRMRRAFADTLWRLTGESYRENAENWGRWWKTVAEEFEPIAPERLVEIEREEEARRLDETAYVEFFGLEIESHRVTFVVDISGSMEWPTRGGTRDTPGEKRMDVARRELIRAIEALHAEAFFNMVPFAGTARSWSRELVRATPDKRAEAIQYVQRLNAGGATAIYNALEYALADPAVDTIYLLSDGEPMGGRIDDPATIREHVRRWNANRGVLIHSIAIGENLELLRWLAADTGGDYVFIP